MSPLVAVHLKRTCGPESSCASFSPCWVVSGNKHEYWRPYLSFMGRTISLPHSGPLSLPLSGPWASSSATMYLGAASSEEKVGRRSALEH